MLSESPGLLEDLAPATEDWDFASAIELVRLQTLSLATVSGNNNDYHSVPRQDTPNDTLIQNHCRIALACKSLGDFEDVLRYVKRPDNDLHKDLADLSDGETNSELYGLTKSFEESPEIDDAIEQADTGLSSISFSEEELDATLSESSPKNLSRERRNVIEGLVGVKSKASKGINRRGCPAGTEPNAQPHGAKSKPPRNDAVICATMPSPDKKLQIMSMLGMPSLRARNEVSLPNTTYDLSNGLSLLPSQVQPVRQKHMTGIHVFVDISNVSKRLMRNVATVINMHLDIDWVPRRAETPSRDSQRHAHPSSPIIIL